MAIPAWPMMDEIVFALAPAAIRKEAQVCRASWSPMGASFAIFHARIARAFVVDELNGTDSERHEHDARRAPGEHPMFG